MKKPMKLPIGYSDFKEVIEDDCYFVDKSFFVRDIINAPKVILFTRPRRFGKTLNMSMLRYFFSNNLAPNVDLFKGLNIESCEDIFLQHYKKHPVIYLTFKDVSGDTYDAVYEKILQSIQKLYGEFASELLCSEKLTDYQKRNINTILSKEVDQVAVEDSLYMLVKALCDHYGNRVCVLIDEYDTPVQCACVHGYYQKIAYFFGNLLNAGIKDNPYLFKCVLTEILCVSRDDLFSVLRNAVTYSIFDFDYSSYFGFTEKEVSDMFCYFKLHFRLDEVKAWDNGCQIGDSVLYNPLSILNCVQEKIF